MIPWAYEQQMKNRNKNEVHKQQHAFLPDMRIFARNIMKAALGRIAAMGVMGLSVASANAEEDRSGPNTEVVDIGNRRELMVDRFLIDTMKGDAALKLNHPVPREIAIKTDAPWEGNACAYPTVFKDEGKYRMYYRGMHLTEKEGQKTHGSVTCYAESSDGIHWEKPDLGIIEFRGSKKNNIVWTRIGSGGLAPFKDSNPDCSEEARYKAIAARNGIWALKSPDGIHWSKLQGERIIPAEAGDFDSHNLAFWDSVREEYRIYFRVYKENGIRGIKTATSQDFIHWSDPVWLEYPSAPEEHLYTNGVHPYHRAPHILVGFPERYVHDRGTLSPFHKQLTNQSGQPSRAGTSYTDGLLMTSRDGRTFHRWKEAFIRPGPSVEENWVYGDNYPSWGMVETESRIAGAPKKISFYVSEGYRRGESINFRRYTIRLDGFASLHAGAEGGEMTTRPLTFTGDELRLNFNTAAAGKIAVEIQTASGKPIEGYTLEDCSDTWGNFVDRQISWTDGRDVSSLAGQPVRLRFVLTDADIYSFRFAASQR